MSIKPVAIQSIAVLAEVGRPVVTCVGFNADQFVLMSGSGDTQYSPSAAINGQVFISDVLIQYGQIMLAKISKSHSSNYVQGRTGTIMKADGTSEINGSNGGDDRTTTDNYGQKVYDKNSTLRVVVGKYQRVHFYFWDVEQRI